MTYIPYIAILLIVLIVHEYGHLLSAQIMGIRASRLQIGIGPTLFAVHSNPTPFTLAPGVPAPLPGHLIDLIARHTGPDTPMQIQAWRRYPTLRQRISKTKTSPAQDHSPWAHHPTESITFSGKVKHSTHTTTTVETMTWAIAPIPLAAYVSLPEAPHHDVPNCYNTTTWRTKMVITAAGVAANIALFIAVTLTLPFIENPAQAQQEPTSGNPQAQARPAQPYHHRVADTTIRYYRGFEAATRSILTNLDEPPPQHAEPYPETRRVCGPICAGNVTTAAIEVAGLYGWVAVLGIVTIFTAMMNLLPLPPLDGWKMALNTVQALRRKPFNQTATMTIEVAAVAFIIFLVLIVVAMDIHHQFT